MHSDHYLCSPFWEPLYLAHKLQNYFTNQSNFTVLINAH